MTYPTYKAFDFYLPNRYLIALLKSRLRGLVALKLTNARRVTRKNATSLALIYQDFLRKNEVDSKKDLVWMEGIFRCSKHLLFIDLFRFGVKEVSYFKPFKKDGSLFDKEGFVPLKTRHREKYCHQNKTQCIDYIKCLDNHVLVEKKDDVPFARYKNSGKTCYSPKEGPL